MNLDLDLFQTALTTPAARPTALDNLRDYLAAAGESGKNTQGWSMQLLFAAAGHGWEDAVRMLLAAGTDVHAAQEWALRSSAAGGHLPVVECLLAAGADVHAVNEYALRAAAMEGHLSVIERLLAAGADVHAVDDKALRLAAEQGHRDIVVCLLAAGADVHAMNNQPLRVALENARRDVVRVLLRHGGNAAAVVRVWRAAKGKRHAAAIRMLDALAADIPADQRRRLRAGGCADSRPSGLWRRSNSAAPGTGHRPSAGHEIPPSSPII